MTIYDCIGMTISEFRKRGFPDHDWEGNCPVISRESKRHAWRIVGIVDRDEADRTGLVAINVSDDCRTADRAIGRGDWFAHDRDIPSIDPLISQLYELADRLGGDDGWLVCEAIGRIESGGAK